MPRATRARTSLPRHSRAPPAAPSSSSAGKTISTPDAIDDSYMMDPSEMAPIQPILPLSVAPPPPPLSLSTRTVDPTPLPSSTTKPRLTKAEKAQIKRQHLLDQINRKSTPYSKSHSRRLKRAARPSANLVTSLSDFNHALPDIEPAFEEEDDEQRDAEEEDQGMLDDDDDREDDDNGSDKTTRGKKNDDDARAGGKGREKLTAKKRQRVLTNESTRMPAILANEAFSKSPFATIRMHTVNTFAQQKAAAAAGGGGGGGGGTATTKKKNKR